MPLSSSDRLYRNLSSSSSREKCSFESFLEKISNRFFFADRTQSAQNSLAPFHFRLYQDRSGIGLMTHVRADGHRIALEWQAQEMRGDAVFFLFILQGEVRLPHETEPLRLVTDSFVVLDAKRPLVMETSEKVEYVFYLLPFDYFQTHAGFRSGHSFGVPFYRDSEIRGLFCRGFREIQRAIPKLNNDEVENLSDAVFVLLRSVLQPYFQSEAVKKLEKNASLLEKTQSVLNEHIADPAITLDRIAREVGVSTRRLSELYAEDGTTVMRRLKEMRLKRASIMLREKHMSEYSVATIAKLCGFKTQAHFSREFKSYYGLVPSDYRVRNVLNRADL